MNKAITEFAADTISSHIGLPVQPDLDPPGSAQGFSLTPSDVHPNDTFAIHFRPGWRKAEAEFVPGMFAAPLIRQMGNAPDEGKSAFVAFASALDKRKVELTFRVNGYDVSPFDTSVWPQSWNELQLQARSALQVINTNDFAQMEQLLLDLVIPLFGMVTSLVGLQEKEPASLGESEGSPYESTSTRYERKRINREACIQLKGTRCAACGLKFSEFYGPIGNDYIEIHHTTPISHLGPNYHINIATDLEPLCANCHAMVHRSDPPIPVPELARIIAIRRNS